MRRRLDVARSFQGVKKRGAAPFRAAATTLGHAIGGQQFGYGGARRLVAHRHVEAPVEIAPPPRPHQRPRRPRLFARIGDAQHPPARRRQRLHRYSARTAANTSVTWPGTLTLRHARTSVPSAPNRKVARSIPI